MLEIWVMGGGSLQMWKEYLGPDGRIVVIDINPECKEYEDENIEIFIGSQDDPMLIDSVFQKYQKIEIVLDDVSHIMVEV